MKWTPEEKIEDQGLRITRGMPRVGCWKIDDQGWEGDEGDK
jgi:hypothetical protein